MCSTPGGAAGTQQSHMPLADVPVCAEAGRWLLMFSDSLSPVVPSLQVSMVLCSGRLKELHIPSRLEREPGG